MKPRKAFCCPVTLHYTRADGSAEWRLAIEFQGTALQRESNAVHTRTADRLGACARPSYFVGVEQLFSHLAVTRYQCYESIMLINKQKHKTKYSLCLFFLFCC